MIVNGLNNVKKDLLLVCKRVKANGVTIIVTIYFSRQLNELFYHKPNKFQELPNPLYIIFKPLPNNSHNTNLNPLTINSM